jgi:hypothetical protein
MTKDERIGFRLPREVKSELLRIAKLEGRSLAQICELFLRAGIGSYSKGDIRLFSGRCGKSRKNRPGSEYCQHRNARNSCTFVT